MEIRREELQKHQATNLELGATQAFEEFENEKKFNPLEEAEHARHENEGKSLRLKKLFNQPEDDANRESVNIL